MIVISVILFGYFIFLVKNFLNPKLQNSNYKILNVVFKIFKVLMIILLLLVNGVFIFITNFTKKINNFNKFLEYLKLHFELNIGSSLVMVKMIFITLFIFMIFPYNFILNKCN